MIVPEHGIPTTARLHTLLPGGKSLLQQREVRSLVYPLPPVLKIDLKMMEVEGHSELVVLRLRISNASLKARRIHLSDRHHALDAALTHQLLDVAVHTLTVRVKAATIALVVVFP